MKVLRARIKPYNDITEESSFLFPTKEDEQLFLTIIPSLNCYQHIFKGKRVDSSWNAWQVLRKKNWWHDRAEKIGDDYFLVWLYPETPLEELELCLRHHDWYYQYSDDHRVWTSGESAWHRIEELKTKVTSSEYATLLDKYAPSKEQG